MKKTLIFCLFLLSLSFSALIFQQPASAEIAGFTISASAKIANDGSNQYVSTDKFSTLTNTFTADYSYFVDSGCIMFTAELTENGEGLAPITPIYEWKTLDGTVLSTSANLVLNKTATTKDTPSILIGESKYVCVVTNPTDGSSCEVGVTVKITDTNNTCAMQTFSPTIPSTITCEHDSLTFCAKIPITSGSQINWYLKTPNSTEFSLQLSNSIQYEFSPSSIVTNQNGYGEYRVMAIGYNKNTEKYYYSKSYTINAIEKLQNITEQEFSISSRVIDNSKAAVEAFKYSLTNSENLNPSQIYWYINTSRVGIGDTFVYEPTTTDAYRIVAKYQKADGTIIELDTLKQEPKTTGTYMLFIYIGVGVLVLTIIFSISIIITNKKRDVVW